MSIRVLVVDDSVVIRRLVTDLLQDDPDIEVVGTAVNGRAALYKVESLKPDLITMDIEMPEMDGIEAVRTLRASGCRLPIIMFSTMTERGAVATLDALAAGATDYVTKPANVGSVNRSMELVRDALIPRIRSLVPLGLIGSSVVEPTPRTPPVDRPVVGRRSVTEGYRLLVIGSSTGGPEALTTLFAALPLLPVPIAVVQHMPPVFTRQFAARLARACAWEVTEVEDDQPLGPGQIAIAPGDHHLEIVSRQGGFVAKVTQGQPENYCRPSVDVLFRSAVAAAGPAVLGVVLTGMGQDGERGAELIAQRGGSVIAQDRATSVVWGMPGAVVNAGLAEMVLPLPLIAAELAARLARPGVPAAELVAAVVAP